MKNIVLSSSLAIVILLISSCFAAKNVSYYECDMDISNAKPLTKRQLPREIMASLNAWGNTGWIVDEAWEIEDGDGKTIQVKLRNINERKMVCYPLK